MKHSKIKGVIVPLLTPFDDRGQIDAAAVLKLVDFLIVRGVKGLFPAGTTGEMPLLTTEERLRLAELVVEAANGRIPVIIHTGSASTQQTVHLTRHAQQIGAQAAALIPPYYYRYGDEALFAHFATVAAEVPDFPIYLYDNPAVAGNTIAFHLIQRLVDGHPNIVGLKDSSGSLDTLSRCAPLNDRTFNTATGPDGLILAGVSMGFDACVSGNANVVPELVVALYNSASTGDLATAQKLQRTLNAVREILGDGADLSLFKGVLVKRGLSVGAVRKPLLQASEAQLTECWQALTALDLTFVPIQTP